MIRPSRHRPAIEAMEDRLVPAPLNLPNDPSLFAPVSMMAPLAMHIHARVEIFVDGQQVVIPANVGVFALAAYPLHTHDDSGTIHVESPVVRDYNLGEFFDVWGVRLTKNCLGGYCTSATHRLAAIVDGGSFDGNPRDIP